MYNLLMKKGQMFAFLLGAIILIIYVLIAMSGQEAFVAAGSPEDSDLFNFGIKTAIVMGVLCLLIAVLFGLYHMLTNMKGAMRGIISVLVLLAIFVIAYMMADGAATGKLAETLQKFDITAGVSKFISGAMTTTAILGALAIGAMVLSEIRNIFK